MGVDLAPFWANLYLHKYESKYITSLIWRNKLKGRQFHSTFQFIYDLCALNDCGEFGIAYFKVYSTELELNVEHNGSHAVFLDLGISIENGKFIHKIFDKRDAFILHIVRMPSIASNI